MGSHKKKKTHPSTCPFVLVFLKPVLFIHPHNQALGQVHVRISWLIFDHKPPVVAETQKWVWAKPEDWGNHKDWTSSMIHYSNRPIWGFLKSWGSPSRHHRCFNTKSWWSFMTHDWMMWGSHHFRTPPSKSWVYKCVQSPSTIDLYPINSLYIYL